MLEYNHLEGTLSIVLVLLLLPIQYVSAAHGISATAAAVLWQDFCCAQYHRSENTFLKTQLLILDGHNCSM